MWERGEKGRTQRKAARHACVPTAGMEDAEVVAVRSTRAMTCGSVRRMPSANRKPAPRPMPTSLSQAFLRAGAGWGDGRAAFFSLGLGGWLAGRGCGWVDVDVDVDASSSSNGQGVGPAPGRRCGGLGRPRQTEVRAAALGGTAAAPGKCRGRSVLLNLRYLDTDFPSDEGTRSCRGGVVASSDRPEMKRQCGKL